MDCNGEVFVNKKHLGTFKTIDFKCVNNENIIYTLELTKPVENILITIDQQLTKQKIAEVEMQLIEIYHEEYMFNCSKQHDFVQAFKESLTIGKAFYKPVGSKNKKERIYKVSMLSPLGVIFDVYEDAKLVNHVSQLFTQNSFLFLSKLVPMPVDISFEIALKDALKKV